MEDTNLPSGPVGEQETDEKSEMESGAQAVPEASVNTLTTEPSDNDDTHPVTNESTDSVPPESHHEDISSVTQEPPVKPKRKYTRKKAVTPPAKEPSAVAVTEILAEASGDGSTTPAAVATEETVTREHEELPEAGETILKEPEELPEARETAPVMDMIGPETEEGEDTEETEVTEEEEAKTVAENFDTYTREQLVDKLEETVKEADISRIKTTVALIKVAFLKLTKDDKEKHLKEYLAGGGDEVDYQPPFDPLEERFNNAFELYKQNKAIYSEEQERLKIQNLEAKRKILEEFKELINSEETLKKTYDEFKNLQERWREIGLVPKNEVNNLWQSYHFLVEKFFDKVKINKELKDLDLRKNLENKIKLCEKAEELLLETSINRSFKQLQKLHEEWKEVGPVPQDKKDEIWERFRSVTEKINERRREYYHKLQEELDNNYQTKLALCEKAELIVDRNNESVADWQDNTRQMDELFTLWRSLGPAPKKVNDKIWERFKKSIDTFFNAKKEYFNKVKEQQVNNYNLKLNLCVQAEALKDNTDWRKTTLDLINLQREWKNIGPVPRKHSNKIWKRFRAACDEFFQKKSEYFSNIQKLEEDNLRRKEELTKHVREAPFTGNKNEDLKIIKELQRQWMDIGHVPMKEKERVQNEFRTAINKQLDKLKIDAVEISAMNYRAHFESLRHSPDANRILFRERGMLVNKISQLKEDISLWENNIGFLANSKNAVLLKNEFEKKINNAKQEVLILETKLRILSEQR